ncbi:putative short chain dehydrogenase/ reductase [Thozetella sp. PMI_491]|nr:putative short chain dehydrogenase/ reductase [Thozetella sp. PMI_491]
MAPYVHQGPIDCNIEVDTNNIRGKTAVVTGGANGIGEAYVRALQSAGCIVAIGDIDETKGEKLTSELSNTIFVKCDTTNWDDQINLFRAAANAAPDGKVSYVVANAGIARQDDVFSYAGSGQEPTKPDLSIANVNIFGPLYTTKLALHYFVKQNGESVSDKQTDTCLVLIGSGAAFLDCPRGPQYSASKWAMRGIMHSLRRTAYYSGSRVNVISPWYVRTNILTEEAYQHVQSVGVQFAEADDAGRCLLRILSDETINGHSFFISARKWAPQGFMDLDVDEYPGNDLIQTIQKEQLWSAPVEDGLFGKPN